MTSLARHRLSPAETAPALRALGEWPPADAPGGGLHPGDVGWLLRFDDATVHLWADAGTPVAVGFLDGPVLRVTAAPGADAGALAADAEDLLVPGNDWSDGYAPPRGTRRRPRPDGSPAKAGAGCSNRSAPTRTITATATAATPSWAPARHWPTGARARSRS